LSLLFQINYFREALWWSFFTLVFGEPIGGEAQTDAGRFVTLIVIIVGLTMFAVSRRSTLHQMLN
jgi:hypothetical protein